MMSTHAPATRSSTRSSHSSTRDRYPSSTQVSEARGIFSLLDKDGNGIVTESELAAMLGSLGQENSPAVVKKMLSTLTSPLEFPAFLTYISSLTSQLSSRDQLHAAFGSFDDSDSGLIDFKDLKNDLMTMGSMRMTEQQVDMALGDFVENTGKNVKVVYERLLDSMVGQRVAQV